MFIHVIIYMYFIYVHTVLPVLTDADRPAPLLRHQRAAHVPQDPARAPALPQV